jgi:hypothetical protein
MFYMTPGENPTAEILGIIPVFGIPGISSEFRERKSLYIILVVLSSSIASEYTSLFPRIL